MLKFYTCVTVVLVVTINGALAETSFISTTPITVDVIVGYSAVLPCRVKDLDQGGAVKIMWMDRNKVPLFVGDRKITTDIRMSVERPYKTDWNLMIRNTRPSDRGPYFCRLTAEPPQIRTVNLQVTRPPIIKPTDETKFDVEENGNVTLECTVTAQPKAKVQWFYINPSSNHLKNLLNYTESVIGDVHTVTLNKITRHQAGIYQCLASNGIPPIAVQNITLDVIFAPNVSTIYTEIKQDRGKDISLECDIEIYPLEKALWRKGKTVFEKGAMDWKYLSEIVNENNFKFVLGLRIFSLEPDDFGVYTCEASNSIGQHSANVTLLERIDETFKTTTIKDPDSKGRCLKATLFIQITVIYLLIK